MASSLVPHLDKYFASGLNVMFIGKHGMGKSETVKQFAESNDINMHYVSAALLDPWVELTGIPTPRKRCITCEDWWPVEMRFCPRCETETLSGETLLNVRPHLIDSASLIMVDEFNRGEKKTINTTFELMQFHSINGEKLPNLKCVWAAINPPDSGQYAVEDLDPALVDRFDVFINMEPQPSFAYYMSLGLQRDTVAAVLAWYKDINIERRAADDVKNHISLRRLEKIMRVYEQTGDPLLAIPNWIDADRNKLVSLLEKARKESAQRGKVYGGGKFGQGAFSDFDYTAEALERDFVRVARYLKDHPADIDTNNAIAQVIKSKHGKTLGSTPFLGIMESMNQTVVEGMIDEMGDMKRETFFSYLVDAHNGLNLDYYPNLKKIKEQFEADFENEAAEMTAKVQSNA